MPLRLFLPKGRKREGKEEKERREKGKRSWDGWRDKRKW